MSVTAAAGFVAGGLACGIKDGGRPDLAVVATADGRPVPAAGVFTTNLATAAPVQVSRAHLADGHAAAIVLSSGNANAATGEQGRAAARRMCELTAAGIGAATSDVLVCSTGLIGIPLPMAPIESGLPALTAQLGATAADAQRAADAILTTDTVRKEAVATAALGSATAHVGGMAKGAAMLSPAMATMLAAITTDAAVTPAVLQRALALAVAPTFDCLVVDGCRSTNDTVLVLASGAAGNAVIDTARGPEFHALADALTDVCGSLAEQMARDAEGATKLARIVVRGAANDAEARLAARAVATSQLVQCSLNGSDPYWGRVLSELGASGAHFDPEQVEIAYGGVVACRHGIAADADGAALAAVMAAREITITCDLAAGHGEATVLTTDLSYGYIDENRRTS
ncbi:MAG TPA: bifunctional glutamate N-acetyltransferase/amino-acid acetyltransferase ArgJ [Acidimicrobiia bacterium]|nr:bifunctional glutamate N-acetyltransferase/amino-acid acetyltransferase ArgJ [Acidimicrobiia bacterium]